MRFLFSTVIVATLTAPVVPAVADDIGGGFSLVSIAEKCQLLTSNDTDKPVVRVTAKGNRVVVIGRWRDCPKTYKDVPAMRLVTATTQGNIFVGADEKGRRTFIRKRWGSSYIFRVGIRPRT